ncbi:MAG: hypothetical protein HYW78_02455 [Parcubacteria group bacterium]|nr:hypothetical protein [Parcubacteria group bacterium]
MATITLSEKKYQELIEAKLKYDYFRQLLTEDIFDAPPTRNRAHIMRELKKTKYYSKAFIKNFSKALRRSTYFTG